MLVNNKTIWFDPDDRNQIITIYQYSYDFGTGGIRIEELRCRVERIWCNYINNREYVNEVMFNYGERNNTDTFHLRLSEVEEFQDGVMYSRYNNANVLKYFKNNLSEYLKAEIKDHQELIKNRRDEIKIMKRMLENIEEKK